MGNNNPDPIRWEGSQAFFITGSELDDDTLRIDGDQSKDECRATLILPTLCITYANMAFANEIGGIQKDYPDSEEYGAKFFDPPVVIEGHRDIEESTWIRGAERVEIGPEETKIRWWKSRTLVIPRLRIKANQRVPARLEIFEATIPVYQPLVLEVMQYANGRHVGGVQITKRHPEWQPPEEGKTYGLWVRVVDGRTRGAIKEADVTILSMIDEDQFALVGKWTTDDMGVVNLPGLEVFNKSLVRVEQAPWFPQFWRYRPHPGQKIRRTFKLWKSKEKECVYTWEKDDRIERFEKILGIESKLLLKMNKLRSEKDLKPRMKFKYPCLEAIYYPDERDKIEDVATLFCYKDVSELARLNQLEKPYELYVGRGIQLPGWTFIRIGREVKFEMIDKLLGLPEGWSRPAQRVLHDDHHFAYYGETVAVPSLDFVKKHRPSKWYELKKGAG